MRAKSGLLLALAVLLALSLFAVVGCGGSDKEAKAELSAALDTVEASIAELQGSIAANPSVDGVKNALATVQPVWAKVVAAAKNVKGADAAAAEQAWTEVETAIKAIPEGASIAEVAPVIMTSVNALLKVEKDLRALVPKE